MIVLGIESTAHTFGVGIMNSEGEVLANIFDSYSSTEGGMVPDKVVQHHEEVAEKVLADALSKAKVSWEEIEFIAYSAGPGLDPALWAGYKKAQKWSEKYGKKLVGVNHCAAHLSIGKEINELEDPVYVYVSGVNTQVITFDGGKYRVMGETLDIGLGNMLDKFGRVIGLGFPAGPDIEKLAKKGKYIELPYVVKGMDTSFSGILSKVKQLYEKGVSKEDLCFSVQEVCFAMLAEVSERALAHTSKKELLLVGGVGANKRFCEMLAIMCQEREAKFYKVPMDLARDNAAMIAWEGFLRKDTHGDEGVKTFWRVDEV
ncbi:tRNA (adenosine(37)-N6)-threonylcarbamoyltransferase complex transferase subunit TsaD [Candidatus Woesearchaeota archaeon]|nr:tRNA (adenosine(37)-N6)-threonylcarbamoyltransferase complex transferase subunit TsaD [Candidatus Woesearchaeota archaeon]